MESALNEILKNYVFNEFQTDKPERENASKEEGNKKRGPRERTNLMQVSVSATVSSEEGEYIEALHECLSKQGIMRQVQTFLRHKMVLLLQDKWPKLMTTSPSQLVAPWVTKLLEDFLCCRKLLYTYSVFCSEFGLGSHQKIEFGKMPCRDAEELLDQMNVPKDCQLSRRILKQYSDRDGLSLLESFIQITSAMDNDFPNLSRGNEGVAEFYDNKENEDAKIRNWRVQNKIDELFDQKSRQEDDRNSRAQRTDERFHEIERRLEKDKTTQIERAIQKFRSEEVSKIRQELDHKMQFQMLSKENDLLANYQAKVKMLQDSMERERSAWLLEKSIQEKEILLQRQEVEDFKRSVEKSSRNCDKKLDDQRKPETRSKSTQASEFDGFQNKAHINVHMQCSPGPNQDARQQQAARSSYVSHFTPEEEDSVMKEARLRSKIRKLEEKNTHLQKKQQVPRNRKPNEDKTPVQHSMDDSSSVSITFEKPERLKKRSNEVHIQVETDRVAFLQYNLEKQADEITNLRKKLETKNSLVPEPLKNDNRLNSNSGKSSDADLLMFLTESKIRCEQIEQEARSVDKRLEAIKKRRSRSSSPVAYHPRGIYYDNPAEYHSHNRRDRLPGPYSSLTQGLLDQIQPLFVNSNPIPTLSRDSVNSYKGNLFSQDKLADPHHKNAVQYPNTLFHLDNHENAENAASNSLNNNTHLPEERSQEKFQKLPKTSKEPKQTLHNPQSKINPVQEAKSDVKASEAASKKASEMVKKGALSFAKISSEEELSQSFHSSLNDSKTSLQSRRLTGLDEDVLHEDDTKARPEGGVLKGNIKPERDNNSAEKVPMDVGQAEGDDNTSMDKSIAADEKSASEEGIQISHGTADDDDFWIM